jgi:hypothetical protein
LRPSLTIYIHTWAHLKTLVYSVLINDKRYYSSE